MIYKKISAEELSFKIRSNSAKIIHKSKSSHIGSVFSAADIISIIYSNYLRFDGDKFKDKFILSKGHACAGVYSALNAIGLLDDEDLKTFASNNSYLMAHISHKVKNVEFSTGSLGHGLGLSIGKSIALKKLGSDAHVYVLLSDGELDEGSIWEGLLFLGHHKISNLTILIDHNKLQSFGSTTKTLDLEPLVEKMKSFNLNVNVSDGHNFKELSRCLDNRSSISANVIICNTIKGFPIDFMKNKVKWHYSPPNDKELLTIQNQLRIYQNEKKIH